MKIPYPGDLNAIEIAVWAAEFVRTRAEAPPPTLPPNDAEIGQAVESANAAVADLRAARDRLGGSR